MKLNEWVAYYQAKAAEARASAAAYRAYPAYDAAERERFAVGYDAMAADYDRMADEEAAYQREVA